MLDLNKELYALISPHTPLYEIKAPEGTALPYAEYSYLPGTDNFNSKTIPLQLDLWDNKPLDTTALWTLEKTLRNLLDEYTKCTTDIGYTIYHVNSLGMNDPSNNTLRRVMMNFTINTYLT